MERNNGAKTHHQGLKNGSQKTIAIKIIHQKGSQILSLAQFLNDFNGDIIREDILAKLV
jgi:hypothetical protein